MVPEAYTRKSDFGKGAMSGGKGTMEPIPGITVRKEKGELGKVQVEGEQWIEVQNEILKETTRFCEELYKAGGLDSARRENFMEGLESRIKKKSRVVQKKTLRRRRWRAT